MANGLLQAVPQQLSEAALQTLAIGSLEGRAGGPERGGMF